MLYLIDFLTKQVKNKLLNDDEKLHCIKTKKLFIQAIYVVLQIKRKTLLIAQFC